MKCVLRAWGQLPRGFEVVALGEMCFASRGQLKRGFEVVAMGEMRIEGMGAVENLGFRLWHWVKCVLRAWGQLKRGFEAVAMGEMCIEGMEAVEMGVGGFGTG